MRQLKPTGHSPAGKYPAQIWLLFWGTLVSMTAQSLVWPFLTIHIRQRLGVPLTAITLLFTLQSVVSLAGAAVLGPAIDRFGRRWAMVGGSLLGGLTLLAMIGAESLAAWGALLSLYALASIGFRTGSNAMIADLIEPEGRAGAYALLRTALNVGIAVGPAVGGFLVATSYALSFSVAAGAQFLLALFVIALLRETLPAMASPMQASPMLASPTTSTDPPQKRASGYGPLLHDRPFLTVWGVFLLVEVASAMVFTLLAVYIKEQFGIPESGYGFILGTNATMVVLFQYGVTRLTQRRAPLPMMALGALFYASGLLVYALGAAFVVFWLGMVVMTVGELILMPTATALVANLAPADMRARYMGVYSLSYRLGSGVGPVIGGLLSDMVAPAATWVGAMGFCLAGAGGFWLMNRAGTLRAAEASRLEPEASRAGD